MSKKSNSNEVTLPFKIKLTGGEYHAEVKDDNGKKWNGIGDTPNNAIRNLLNNIDIKSQKDEESQTMVWIELNYNKALELSLSLGNSLGNEARLIEFSTKGLSIKTGETIESLEQKLRILCTFGIVKHISGDFGDPYVKWVFLWDYKMQRYELEQRLKAIELDKRKTQKRLDVVNNEALKFESVTR